MEQVILKYLGICRYITDITTIHEKRDQIFEREKAGVYGWA